MRRLITLFSVVVPMLGGCAARGGPKQMGYEKRVSEIDSRVGILLMAHGGSAEWNRSVERAVAPLRSQGPLAVAFGMADRDSLQRAVRELETQDVRRIAVVRLFVSGSSFLARTEALFGVRAKDAYGSEASIRGSVIGGGAVDGRSDPAIQHSSEIAILRRGLAESPEIGSLIRHRAESLSRDPPSESVLILAHGMGVEVENATLLKNMRRLADSIWTVGEFRDVRVETLREDWVQERQKSEVRIRSYVEEQARSGTVLVVPFRLSGFGPYADVLEGLEFRADSLGLLPHPMITEWIINGVEETACLHGWAYGWTVSGSAAAADTCM